MISIVTYHRRPEVKSVQERNVAKTAGTGNEYLVIDGSKGALRFAAAYNWAASQAKGDILVFLADDVYFMDMNWGVRLSAKFAADPSLGVVGVAGTQYLFADKCSWTAAGRPFIKGRIVYHLQNGDFFAAVFSQEKGDFEAVALDGCFLAVRAELCRAVRFDEAAFGGTHFWDLDFCLRARVFGRVIVSSEVTVKKMSQPVYDSAWQEAGAVFLRKHAAALPASCAQYPGVPIPGPSSQMVNLKGRYSPDTIC
jgi:GT2 family glycosyltransferase